MNPPDERLWLRVEALGGELGLLPNVEAAARLLKLAEEGESPTVITLLGSWLSLPPPPAPLAAGDVVGGRYTLREKLGEGGMGSVWRARQEMVGRDIALKMIHPALATPGFQTRFLAEVNLLGQLDHPGIIRIYDAGAHEEKLRPSIPFFAMELVDGLPLDRWAAEHRGELTAQLRVGAAICSAVQSAHERRIVHRDLKPANILIRHDGQPVVVDFGIARLAGVAAGEERGMFSGTPQYAAPEQFLGRDGDFRSGESVDVYAMGALLFELLSGRRMRQFPRGFSMAEARRIVLETPAPRLSESLPDCLPFLEDIVARAVRPDPADRYYSMSALGRAIERALSLAVPAVTPPPPWAPAPGVVVPGTRWRLESKIGEGGAGQVWSGRHDQLGERRVFKFCDTEAKARTLKREATLFRLLKERVGRNPHFIQLHEVSLDEPPWYLMMDLVEARDLEHWSAEQPDGLAGLRERTRIEIIAQAAEALQAAHDAGILHRDIKPSNLLIGPGASPGLPHVFVADFGIGQLTAESLLADGTRLGFTRTVSDLMGSPLSGTMLYLAPEVLEGNPATARSDIYSLGVVFWQLLTGNLRAALDPADWAARIEDPLLREDLSRCLAGAPEKRWSSAGELAARLRGISDRRAAAARAQREIVLRERAAYRRGVARAAAVAAAVLAVVAGLGLFAWSQWGHALKAQGESALEQAKTLRSGDFAAGRMTRGLALLEVAARTVTNHAALRTTAASVLGMADLTPQKSQPAANQLPVAPGIPVASNETCRAASHNGALVAVGLDLDGLNGALILADAATGRRRFEFTRTNFPWIPVAEPGMLQFSPDDQWISIGGAATSRHVLIFGMNNVRPLRCYLFHGSDPRSCAWHPRGRILAVGCEDGAIRLWDTAAAVSPKVMSKRDSQFDLPPALDDPALDNPVHFLRGHRGPVRFLAFSPDGHWLASLDQAGYLRIHTGFSTEGLPELPPPERAGDPLPGKDLTIPTLAIEVRLNHPETIASLTAEKDRLVVGRTGGPGDVFQFAAGDLPAEFFVAPGLKDIAWNAAGTELCATTFSDVYWLGAAPLQIRKVETNKNPFGVAWQETNGFWALPSGTSFSEIRLDEAGGAWSEKGGVTLPLREAVRGQGVQTGAATDGTGRVAVYYGRRIQFFNNHQMAPEAFSVTSDGGGGRFEGFVLGPAGATPRRGLCAALRAPSLGDLGNSFRFSFRGASDRQIGSLRRVCGSGQ